MRSCPICDTNGKEIFTGRLLKKYDVKYYQCPKCALVYTESPYWLPEAYSDAISRYDTGVMQRNVTDMLMVNTLLELWFKNKRGVFLDYGGGYGIFTRMMRDIGYNWLWYDKYSENLVVRGYEYCHYVELGKVQKIDLITAFELFEHMDQPLKELEHLLSISRNVLFSTMLYDEKFAYKELDEWWYYSVNTGQHISFYSQITLEYLAEKNKIHYYKINDALHLFTDQKISEWKLKVLKNPKLKFIQYYYYNKNCKNGLAFADMNELYNREK